MNRRKFLQTAAAAPAVVALPEISATRADAKEAVVRGEQGWPKLMVGDVVARSTMHDGFLQTCDEQTIHGMVVAADDNTYTVALIESPERRLFRHRR